MFCMTVSYPIKEDSQFDHLYYREKHLPLCEQLFSDYGYKGNILRTDTGRSPTGHPCEYTSVDLLFETREGLQAAVVAKGGEVSADVPKFTTVTPRVVFSQIVVHG